MRALIVSYLPWILSVVTIVQMGMAGNKHRKAWAVGLFGQVLWTVWIVASNTRGLIPLTAALWIIYYRNHVKWRSQ